MFECIHCSGTTDATVPPNRIKSAASIQKNEWTLKNIIMVSNSTSCAVHCSRETWGSFFELTGVCCPMWKMNDSVEWWRFCCILLSLSPCQIPRVVTTTAVWCDYNRWFKLIVITGSFYARKWRSITIQLVVLLLLLLLLLTMMSIEYFISCWYTIE